MVTLPTLKVKRLYRQISELLIQKIKDGEFKAGDSLPSERDLAQQLGVSRSSVREALIALEIAGWVDIRTGHGVFVCDQDAAPNPPEALTSVGVEELLTARALIESETARLAAKNATSAQLAELAQLMDELEREPENTSKFLTLDKHLHVLIGEMADNSVLSEFIEILWTKRHDQLFAQFENRFGGKVLSIAMNHDHRKICDAILNRDPAAAKKAMQAHIAHVHKSFFMESASIASPKIAAEKASRSKTKV